MPVYEYRCEPCGPFERWRDHRESGEPRCPECGASARRVYSAPAFTAYTKAEKEVRRRAERGSEPQVAGRQSAGDPSPKPRKSGGRPWQISH